MSLLLAHVSPMRAMIATDTAAQLAQGLRPIQTSKMAVLPHLHAVVACIGNVDAHAAISSQMTALNGDLDAFFDAPLSLINPAYSEYARQVGDALVREMQGVAVVGWSPKSGRVIGVYAERISNANGFESFDINGTIANPRWPSYEHQDRSTDAALVEAACKQVAYVREAVPECPIGGQLTIAEIDRDGIQLRRVQLDR